MNTEQEHLNCDQLTPNLAVFFGYVYYNGLPQLTLDQSCNTLVAQADPVPSNPPAALTMDVAMFKKTVGHELLVNGALVATDNDRNAVSQATQGAIGRGLVQTTHTNLDPRFRGDIAEILVYDAALEDADRSAIEDYLKNRWQ